MELSAERDRLPGLAGTSRVTVEDIEEAQGGMDKALKVLEYMKTFHYTTTPKKSWDGYFEDNKILVKKNPF